MADTFLAHFCLDRCNWGTRKSLEIAWFCELFQNVFYFKDVPLELSSWSVRKVWNFWFNCIINLDKYQSFVVVCLKTYICVKLTLCVCYLFRLYIKHVKKRGDKTKMILEDKKHQNKIYKHFPKFFSGWFIRLLL